MPVVNNFDEKSQKRRLFPVRTPTAFKSKFFKKAIDKRKNRAYNVGNNITKEKVAMTASKFFYYFAKGCPSFVKSEM